MAQTTGCLALCCCLTVAASAAQRPPGADSADVPEYLVGPGDVLHVFVWKEQELTRDVTVRFDGRITVPLLGDVQAAGLTPRALTADIEQKLSRFLGSPQVTVGVTQPNSTRIFVVGQVARPGVFPLTGPTTFLQMLALAGGFKDFAKTDRVLVVRQDGASYRTLTVDYKRIESGSDVGQNIALRSGDTIVVP